MNPPGPDVSYSSEDPREHVAGRLRELAALLFAIERAELFADLPSDSSGGTPHEAGLGLLSVIEREIHQLLAALEPTSENDAPH
jgi:hypothetical protein